MPLAYDQADNAERLRRLGVGLSLPPRAFRGPAVARLLGRLLVSADVADRCREYARRTREGKPIDDAGRAIEELAPAGAASTAPPGS
jgi:UDP:flavonoid glycosyltransferase YjiC (YdhE family)